MSIPMSHRSTHLIAFIAGVFFLVFGTVLVFFISNIEKQRAQLEELRLADARIEQNKDTLNSLVTRLASTKDARTSLEARILPDAGVVDLLTLIESIAKEQKVALTTHGLAVLPIDERYESLVVNVEADGGYESLVRLLTIFEHLPYQVTVHTVEFARVGDTEDTWNSAYVIQITKTRYAN